MKAIVRHRFGSPDVLEFAEIPRPVVGPDQILIAVHAAAVNRGDALELRGWPYVARLSSYGLWRPRRQVLGTDVAGTVVAVGSGVGRFDVDDEVVGWSTGAWAELAVLDASRTMHRPGGLASIDAAAIPTTGVAALQALRAGRVRSGSEVVVIGASGGVGTFAVQVARSVGATVTVVAGTDNVDLVRSIGAEKVVDHRVDDITESGLRVDAVIDLVGNRPIREVRRLLRRDGTLVVVGGHDPQTLTGMRRFASAATRSPFTRQRLVPLFATQDRDDLSHLLDLVTAGDLRSVVGATVDLSDVAEGVRRVETGHTAGKLVVTT